MIPHDIDLKKEQETTFKRKPRHYSALARLMFWMMDTFYGRKLTWGKIRLLEILARLPYQAWEIRQYHRMNRLFSNAGAVEQAAAVVGWSREAQDSEFWHLQVIDDRMKQLQIPLHWFKDRIMPSIASIQYSLFSRLLAFLSQDTAYLLNADFEDHAEHEYMTFARENPELDDQPVTSTIITGYRSDLQTWGDVMRFIGLEERDHMNNSLRRCGRESETVPLPAP